MLSEKLVRDRIPEIIRQKGGAPQVRIARGTELDKLIRLKIAEESQELLNSGADEEIADVLEALDALLAHRSIGRSEIEDTRLKKRQERGGFDKGFILKMSE
ncbi:MAG: nucleoside triphosphate pyrophosphohydrolase [Candidatus Thorarchaeota archaeon]